MPQPSWDRYYRYDELTDLIQGYADDHPDLVQVESIGTSYEGRHVWVATVTNAATGPAESKPAFWVEGNIHASELSPSAAVLYLLDWLVKGYGERDDVTRALDTRAFYLCPRVNPDGAEWALADEPKIIRSSTRPWPYDEEPIEGLYQQDVDGDGRMLQMRIEDPNGPWKIADEDPRLLVRRGPTETGGTYYRVLPEGLVRNFDGVTIELERKREGLDLNRNFPAAWRQEGEQTGAGAYPASEPEVRNVVEFTARHPNITGGISFHTFSGVLLRPHSTKSDDEMPAEDLWTFQKIGAKGTEITGYPAVSVYHDFRYHPREIITGAWDDWAYEHRGLYAWTVEIWSPQQQAGIEDYKFIDWYREHPIEDDLKLLRWSDEELGGRGYVDWYEVEHPQLGTVELGGWDTLHCWRNPPPEKLEAEISLFPEWVLWHLLISPRLELFREMVEPLGGGAYRIEIAVHNTGWLPTYVSKKALKEKVVRGVVGEIEVPDGATLSSGKPRVVAGQLEGRAYKGSAAGVWSSDPTADRVKFEWVVVAPTGGEAIVTVRHERAGTVRRTVSLEPSR